MKWDMCSILFRSFLKILSYLFVISKNKINVLKLNTWFLQERMLGNSEKYFWSESYTRILLNFYQVSYFLFTFYFRVVKSCPLLKALDCLDRIYLFFSLVLGEMLRDHILFFTCSFICVSIWFTEFEYVSGICLALKILSSTAQNVDGKGAT